MVRPISLLMLLVVSLVGASGCATSGKNENIQLMQKTDEIRVYEVFGMDCPGCHGGLEKLVRKVPGIQQVEANWKEKKLVITVKPGVELNEEEVFDAIERANFTVGKRIK